MQRKGETSIRHAQRFLFHGLGFKAQGIVIQNRFGDASANPSMMPSESVEKKAYITRVKVVFKAAARSVKCPSRPQRVSMPNTV